MRAAFAIAALAVIASSGRLVEARASTDPVESFRHGNEAAAERRFEEAISRYEEARTLGARSASLYWNWGHAAAAAGRRAEALWAFSLARLVDPADPSIAPQIERLRATLGLDPAETSLGAARTLSIALRAWRLDWLAVALLASSLLPLLRAEWRRASLVPLALGLALALVSTSGLVADPRAVIVTPDAPLFDAPREGALTLSRLREGEFVPTLATERDFVQIQDASGARGFVRRQDLRPLATHAPGRSVSP